ncbi:RnfH family protein [Enterovibrio norvegicus]|uniref:RnfH family protein n=1 Tax=Enterovibrio norvegicus TaxID=188144 RepID=UPI0002E81EC9|nr:RnfH family protein [Enterovibrio norvegicus]MCC4799877.1 RnfH family protein [Enterovibrio norvegicus]OEF64079.1 RnfH family protein [Enterovibrio norvegicus]PMI34641.1 RnfH family protein [Enterovibrio norvegicus]PMN47159.1 RnfH family protein [Enterovibrio norvegicus]
MSEKLLHIEVMYALPNEQRVFKAIVTPDMHVEDIIRHSGILDAYPEIDLAKNKVGVFSRLVKLDALVHDGDRIEIYRPLVADPKEIRRRRAERMKADGTSDPVTGGKVNPQRKSD